MQKNNYYVLIMAITTALQLVAVPGVLDPTFGNSGLTITPISNEDMLYAGLVGAYADEIVIVGFTKTFQHDLLVARYTVDGDPDTSFNGTGMQTLLIGSRTEGLGVTIQSDNKIVAGGFAIQYQTDIAVARFNTDGSIDTSFNTVGYNTESIDEGAIARSIELQSTDDIVLGGASHSTGLPQFTLVRYDPSGNFDTSFGTSGIASTTIGLMSSINKIAIQSDDKIVAVGFTFDGSENHIAVARFNADGSIDTGFGTSGIITEVIGTQSMAYDVVIQNDGMIVVAGYAVESDINESILIRYTTAGALDTGFNTTGVVKTIVEYGSRYYTVGLQTDQKIVAGGSSNGPLSVNANVARYTTAGALDAPFGTGGVAIETVGSSACYKDLDFQSDGKIVTMGIADNKLLLSRYTAV